MLNCVVFVNRSLRLLQLMRHVLLERHCVDVFANVPAWLSTTNAKSNQASVYWEPPYDRRHLNPSKLIGFAYICPFPGSGR